MLSGREVEEQVCRQSARGRIGIDVLIGLYEPRVQDVARVDGHSVWFVFDLGEQLIVFVGGVDVLLGRWPVCRDMSGLGAFEGLVTFVRNAFESGRPMPEEPRAPVVSGIQVVHGGKIVMTAIVRVRQALQGLEVPRLQGHEGEQLVNQVDKLVNIVF